MSHSASFFNRRPSAAPANPALRERDERLEALKGTVGRLAHDFNNVLVPLLGYVTLIREEVAGETTAAQYAATMEGAARQTEAFLDSILLAVRPQRRFNPKTFNFADLLRRLLREWEKGLPAGNHIAVTAQIDDCILFVEESHWINAINQLLANARFALAVGGHLEIILSKGALTEEESLDLNVLPGEVVKLTVRDNGFGMTHAVLRRACEPFYTTRTGASALGLGLTIVHSVTLTHGGQMVISSGEDQGTTVTLYLPVFQPGAEGDTSRLRRTLAHPRVAAKPGSKILLVEDDPLVREVVKSCLLKTQRELVVANDGEEGLRVFKRCPKDWALIVSDITMPKMNGLEMYEAMLEIEPETQVILVSGDAVTEFEKHFTDPNGRRPLLVKKPFTLKSFFEIVKTHLE